MARRKIVIEHGKQALESCAYSLDKGESLDRKLSFTAARYALEELNERAPGRAVEVRVPPAGAIQILGGTTHRRGTPPAVVETSVETWLRLATGLLTWEEAISTGLVNASGERTDLSHLLPL
ncbi:hypothetical protein KRX54_02515 [Actinomycetaceae bacterium TAE3-ERU4]|nr:hypothetical protein [Actinomycetaceae bacterium TAE3-ERU4]